MTGDTDHGRRLSPLQASLAAIGTAILGFIGGVALSQSDDYLKSAADCVNALTDYKFAVQRIDVPSAVLSDPRAPTQQKNDAIEALLTDFEQPVAKINNVCDFAIFADSDRAAWTANVTRIDHDCYMVPSCTEETAHVLAQSGITTAEAFTRQAQVVTHWGLFRRASWAATHWY